MYFFKRWLLKSWDQRVDSMLVVTCENQQVENRLTYSICGNFSATFQEDKNENEENVCAPWKQTQNLSQQ